jgi:hypothetical protein
MLTRFMSGAVPPEVRRSLRWVRVAWLVGLLTFVGGVIVLTITESHNASPAVSACITFHCPRPESTTTGFVLIGCGVAVEILASVVGNTLIVRKIGRPAYVQMMAQRRMSRRFSSRGMAYGPMQAPGGPMQYGPPTVPGDPYVGMPPGTPGSPFGGPPVVEPHPHPPPGPPPADDHR